MSSKLFAARNISQRYLLIFANRHQIGERTLTHGRFREKLYSPFAPKFKEKERDNIIVDLGKEGGIIYQDTPARSRILFILVTLIWFSRELYYWKEDKVRIARQRIKFQRMGWEPTIAQRQAHLLEKSSS